jgi:hypothetical protein
MKDLTVSLVKSGQVIAFELLGHALPEDVGGSVTRLILAARKELGAPIWPIHIEVC